MYFDFDIYEKRTSLDELGDLGESNNLFLVLCQSGKFVAAPAPPRILQTFQVSSLTVVLFDRYILVVNLVTTKISV